MPGWLFLTGALGWAEPLRTAESGAGAAALIGIISAVGPEGSGNVAASKAWKELAAQDVKAVAAILSSLDHANDFAVNWLRSAIETIVARELSHGGALPAADLEKFVLDRSHQPHARRLAFELLGKAEPGRCEKLLPGMIDDPSSELRREAVARQLVAAGRLEADGKSAEARQAYQQLLTQARDADQVDGIAKTLRKMGDKVDIARAFGFLTEWKVIGPFDNKGGKGFAAVYPPEETVDLKAAYQGKTGSVSWRDFASQEDYGDISMNLPFTHLKAATAYAFTEFYSDKARPVELRLGSDNGFKVWLNGQYLFGQAEYHTLKEMDQYPMRAELKAGKNQILVKVCQNEQTEDWADSWEFQLRICDLNGAPLAPAKGGAQ